MLDQQRWKAIAERANTDQLRDYAYLELANDIMDSFELHPKDSEVIHTYLSEVRNKQSTMYLIRLSQTLLYIDLNYAESEKAIEQGVENAPTDFMWYFLRGQIAATEGRVTDALRWMNTALGADLYGGRSYVLIGTGQILDTDGRSDEAIGYYERANALEEGSADTYKALTLIRADRIPEAEMLIEKSLGLDLSDRTSASLPVDLPFVFIKPFIQMGHLARGQELLSRSLAQVESTNDVDLFFVAEGYFALGDLDRGFEFLERAVRSRSWYAAVNLRSRVMTDALGHDPRFEEMLRLLDSVETHTDKFL